MDPLFSSVILAEQAQQAATPQVHALLEAELSHNEIASSLRNALKATNPGTGTYYWPREVYNDRFVYEMEVGGQPTQLYERPYTIDEAGAVTLGDAAQVRARTVYEPIAAKATESADLELHGDLVPLVEAKAGKLSVKVIEAGWGSSGYYPAEMLKRDGPKVFTKGLPMFADHPTTAEEALRPERSIRDIAAVLDADATWQDNGPMGPGLYATATVTEQYRPLVTELAPHIGVSIRAVGKARTGEAEGRKGKIIESIPAAKSVDFVTAPGAGGRFQQLVEAARSGVRLPAPAPAPAPVVAPTPTTPAPVAPVQEAQTVTPEEAQRLQEAQAQQQTQLAEAQREIARLREVNLLREARDFVVATLRGMQMPEMTRVRLTEQLAGQAVVKDGAIDADAFRTLIQETAKAEVAYLTSVTGAGRISGMGSISGLSESPKPEEVGASLEGAFSRLGLSEASAKVAAAGRN